MKKTTVKYIYDESENYPLVINRYSYRCLSCKAVFCEVNALNTATNYQYCPYCGRKIKKTVN